MKLMDNLDVDRKPIVLALYTLQRDMNTWVQVIVGTLVEWNQEEVICLFVRRSLENVNQRTGG